MRGVRHTWLRALLTRMQRERTFLPQRLGLITLAVLILSSMLFVRTELRRRQSPMRLLEVSLQSKLLADYAIQVMPAVAFAPLRLALVEAKIRDENPYLSESEMAALIQTVIAAAQAPIVTATPTPELVAQTVIKAAVVVAPLKPFVTRPTFPALGSPTSATSVDIETSTMVPVTPHASLPMGQLEPELRTTPAAVTTGPTPSAPTLGVLAIMTLQPRSTPSALAWTPSSSTHVPTSTPVPHEATSTAAPIFPTPTSSALTPASTFVATLTPTEPGILPTHLAALQSQTSTPTPSPSPVALPPLVATFTALPSATWTPTPRVLSGSEWTATTTPAVPPSPIPATPTIVASNATTTPLSVVPIAVTPTGTATPSATNTAPPPTATLMPTATASPTHTVVAPTVINLTARVANDKVYLSWLPTSTDGIVGYNLYRAYAGVAGLGNRLNAALLVELSYVDTVTPDGSQYIYVVTAIGQLNQESAPSQRVEVKVADLVAPNTPINIAASLAGTQLQLWWQANSEPDFAGYNIYRSNNLPVDRSQGPLNGATLLATPAYHDVIVLDGQTYYYILTAVDLVGNESLPSIEAQMFTVNLDPPAAPAGLTVAFTGNRATLQWQANSEADLAGYRLYRGLALPVDIYGAPLHSEALLTDLHYADQALQRGQTYYYVLVAVDRQQKLSLPSAPVVLTVPE